MPMAVSLPLIRDLLKTTVRETMDDNVPTMAAAIAYSTLFALPPLLVMIVGIAGAVFGPDVVQEALLGQVSGIVGAEAEEALRTMIAGAGDLGSGLGAKLVGLVTLIIGATGAFGQLQQALNRAWEVEPAPGGGLRAMITKRLLSFGLVVTIAFLLLVSLAVSAALAAVGDAAAAVATDTVASPLMSVANAVLSLAVITALFAALFKVLPDAEIAWRDVAVGAAVTALLFTVGKLLIGLYIGRADPGSAFGAAGSVVLILLWIYYSALIVLVGAEFTQAWAIAKGGGVTPSEGAVAADDSAAASDTPPASTPLAETKPASGVVKADDPPTDAGGFSIEDASSGITRR